MKSSTSKPVTTTTVDAYLAGLPANIRESLEKLRKTIKAAAPNADEVLSYGIPAYKCNGMLIGFGAAKTHCALYVMSTGLMGQLKDELASYDTSKDTIRFQPDKPLPVTLVKKIIKARLEENEAARQKAK